MNEIVIRNYRRFVMLWIYIAFVVVSALVLETFSANYSGYEWFKRTSFVIFADIMFFAAICKTYCIRLFSLPFLFCAFSYLFNFGEVILFGIVRPGFQSANHITMYGPNIYKPAILLCYIIQSCVIVGIMLSRMNYERCEFDFENVQAKNLGLCRSIRSICMFVCFPIEIILDAAKIYLLRTSGYAATYQIVGLDGLSAIGSFYIIGFVLCLYLAKENNKSRIMLIEIAYIAISMLSGDRAKPAVNICIILYFYFILRSSRKKMRFRSSIFIVILAYLGMIFLGTITNFRGKSVIDFSTFSTSLDYVLHERTPIVSFLYEFGSSVYTPIATYDYLQMTGKYGHGITFLLAPIYVVPNIFGITSGITPMINYAKIIKAYGLSGAFTQIGASYTGEIIYNFHYIFPLVGIALGLFISCIDKKIEKAIYNNDFVKVSCFILGFAGLVFYVRGVFFEVLKRWGWSVLMIFLIKNVLKGRDRGSSSRITRQDE